MKKAVIALSCFLVTTFAHGQDNETKLNEYPSYQSGLYFFNCTRAIAEIPGMVQQIGPIENAIWICACTLDKFRAIYTHEEMSSSSSSPWMRGESERFGRECYNDFVEQIQRERIKNQLQMNPKKVY
jgi:hypothetical protein